MAAQDKTESWLTYAGQVAHWGADYSPMAEMFALKTIEYVAKYLPRAVKDGNDKEARAYMALANTFAGYYMMCTSAHTMEHGKLS